jgi:elongation factor P
VHHDSSVHIIHSDAVKGATVISTTDFRGGVRLMVDGEPFYIVEFQHVKPGKGGAFVRTKLKSYLSGNVLDRTFRSGERFEEPDLEEREMQFLYATGDDYTFMDTDTYEQLTFEKRQLGDNADLLKENMNVKILVYEHRPIDVELPIFIELKVVDADPGVRGDTASGGTKPAVVETGATIKVPLYLEVGNDHQDRHPYESLRGARSVSRKKPRKARIPGTPIVLPGSFGTKSAQDAAAQTRQIQELIDLLKRNHLTELEIERAGIRIRVRHEIGIKTVSASVSEPGQASAPAVTQQAVPASELLEVTAGHITITSPIVGTFYRSPSPDADPYVEEGDYVKKGQVLCIVEAMKLMNEIESEVDGRITKILVESTKPVEYGQALFLIDPKATP